MGKKVVKIKRKDGITQSYHVAAPLPPTPQPVLPVEFQQNITKKVAAHQNQKRFTLQVMRAGQLVEQHTTNSKILAKLRKNTLQAKYPDCTVFLWGK